MAENATSQTDSASKAVTKTSPTIEKAHQNIERKMASQS